MRHSLSRARTDEKDQGDSIGRYERRSKAKADTVRLLVKHGADVSVQDETDSTPLHLAALYGSSETVRILLKRGADVNILDGNRKTPLHLASSRVSVPTAHY